MQETIGKPGPVSAICPTLRPVVTPARIVRVLTALLFLLLLTASLSLVLGPGDPHLFSMARRLFSLAFGGDVSLHTAEKTILFSIRLPRVLLAAVVGASLSLSGVVFQALLRNPLADPYILGISGGAAVGAIVGMIAGASLLPCGVPGLAFGGAMVTVALLFGVAGSKGIRQVNTLLLTGVTINAFFSAAIMFLIAMSRSERLHSILFWLMGDLSLAEGRDILTAGAVLLVGFGVMTAYARPLNLLAAGEETALQLGVDLRRMRVVLLVTASAVTSVAVSVSGAIGFVGLIIPHILRLLLGPDHRLLLPASILFGAAFLTAADTVARIVMAPVELPVGVVTALCGAPFFVFLLHRRSP